MATCATCKHFIGAGDWNLCCDLKYGLCYEHTLACREYEYQMGGALAEFMRTHPERLNKIDFSWWMENDVLQKAKEHGKEKRKPYRGPKAVDCTCRNHGTCKWCEENRKHKFRDKHPEELEDIKEEQ